MTVYMKSMFCYESELTESNQMNLKSFYLKLYYPWRVSWLIKKHIESSFKWIIQTYSIVGIDPGLNLFHVWKEII